MTRCICRWQPPCVTFMQTAFEIFCHPAILFRILVAHQSPCEGVPADSDLVAREEQVPGDKREGATRKSASALLYVLETPAQYGVGQNPT